MTLLHKAKPGGWFWWTTLFAIPLLYVASFGPACWIVSRTVVGHAAFRLAYRPLDSIAWHGPYQVRQALQWYGDLAIPKNRNVVLGLNDCGVRRVGPEIMDDQFRPIDKP